MKTLIISVQGIGNLIMALPMIGQLKGKIDFYVSKPAISLIKGQSFVNKIFQFNMKSVLRDLFKLRKEKYDVAITIFPHSRLYTKVFMWLIGAKKRLQNESGERKHSVHLNLDLIDKEYKPYKYVLDKDAKKWTKKFKGKYIGIHAGCNANQAWKRWSMDKWLELIMLLTEKFPKYTILFFVGPDEQNIQPMKNVIQISEKIPRTLALISKCKFFISNDSGLAHMASIFQIPQLTIFGPTDSVFVKPFSPNSHIITPKNNIICYAPVRGFFRKCESKLEHLKADEVFKKIQRLLK
jgi:ADP-heptose:LPS heptosyltransferase